MKYPLLFLLLFLSQLGSAQGIGLHPPGVDWYSLQAGPANVIFPRGYEARARRVGTLIERLAEDHRRSIGDQLYDFDLVLQTPNMTVNGYVGLAPFRSEFYTTPPQSFSLLSNTDWVDLLTIHEFRHVQQNSNERRGITALGSYLQGQLGWAVLANLATPNWFSEGDAVVAETALTGGGRGRTPAFSGELRSLLHNDIVYRYAKARNGSFRDLVPDHYRYGYALLTYARERYGNDVWKPVLHEAAAYRGIFYPFSRALKRHTGRGTRTLYRETMRDLGLRQDSFLTARGAPVAGKPVGSDNDRHIRNYRFPFLDGDGRLLALRTDYDRLPALVVVGRDGARDEVITNVGIQREPWLDGGSKLAVWTETRQHPRYTNRTFSEIVTYQLAAGRKRTLTENGNYVSATLSADQGRIAAVHFDPLAGGPELHLLDAATGQLLQRRALAEETNASWPRFGPDGQTVYFLGQNFDGVAIRAWRTATDAVEEVSPRGYEPIDMLNVTPAGDLLYTSGRDGIDNVYLREPGGNRRAQLTRVPIGAYYPVVGADRLYYSSPTPGGQRLRELPLDPAPLTGAATGKATATADNFFLRPAAFAAEATNLPLAVETREYPVTDISNTLSGLRLHSWSYNGSYTNPGVFLSAANALNTVAIDVGADYNINENRYAGSASLTYGGLYPVIELTGQYRDRNTVVQRERRDSLRFFRQEFNQLSLGAAVRVPLRWLSGNFLTAVTPEIGYEQLTVGDVTEAGLPSSFGSLGLGIDFSALQRLAVRQVQSRLGVTTSLRYDRALSGGDTPGARLRWRNALYLPGAFPTHGIRLELDYRSEQSENAYQYPDFFRYARGFDRPLADRTVRIGVNYQLPLLYPDIGLFGITYFKRVRLNAFYDYSRNTIDAFDFSFDYNSVGGQLFFDNVWMNAQDLTVGVEAAYRLTTDLFSADRDDLQFRVLVSGSF